VPSLGPALRGCRLHACWPAWRELTDPATCGYTGELRSPSGPSTGCTKGEYQIGHRILVL
jgi:hypothetical protein